MHRKNKWHAGKIKTLKKMNEKQDILPMKKVSKVKNMFLLGMGE